MAHRNPCQTLYDLQPGNIIEVWYRGDTFTLEVGAVNVETDKPDMYGSQYHVLV